MARTAKRDLTRQHQLPRGPVDLPYLGLVLILLGIGLVMLLSSSSYVASIEKTSNYDGAYYFKRQAAFAAMGLVIMYNILTQLVDVACLTGIVSCGLNTTRGSLIALEADNIVSLPAVQ